MLGRLGIRSADGQVPTLTAKDVSTVLDCVQWSVE